MELPELTLTGSVPVASLSMFEGNVQVQGQ